MSVWPFGHHVRTERHTGALFTSSAIARNAIHRLIRPQVLEKSTALPYRASASTYHPQVLGSSSRARGHCPRTASAASPGHPSSATAWDPQTQNDTLTSFNAGTTSVVLQVRQVVQPSDIGCPDTIEVISFSGEFSLEENPPPYLSLLHCTFLQTRAPGLRSSDRIKLIRFQLSC
jgi:hypothetical protein